MIGLPRTQFAVIAPMSIHKARARITPVIRRGLASKSPPASSRGVRRRMQATRQRDTRIETELRSQLHRLGLRFRVQKRLLLRSTASVDIVFPTARVAVFVDSCYWHGCPTHGTVPK